MIDKPDKGPELADPNPPMPVPTPPADQMPPMIWDDYKLAFVERCFQARRDAYNTALRPSNDHLEAAMFLAMLTAYFDALPDGTKPIPVPPDYQSAPEQHVIPKVKDADKEVPHTTRRGRHE
jgi:hypothetical protein